MTDKFHRAFGCYGIIGDQQNLVVIKKEGGPYINRYDLPGGSLKDGEPLDHAVKREVNEETGLVVQDYDQIGVTSIRYPWDYEQWHFNQHICVFYKIDKFSGNLQTTVKQFTGARFFRSSISSSRTAQSGEFFAFGIKSKRDFVKAGQG